MSALAKLLSTIGMLSLFHAAYSAHEHSTLSKLQLQQQPQTASQLTIPLDIKLETLVAVLLVCVGLVLSQDPFKPISWSTWAGKLEREGGGMNPFRALEDRVGFMDIRTKRQEFADWMRQGGSEEVKR